MSSDNEAPGTVRKKRFPVKLDLAAPAAPKKPWDVISKTASNIKAIKHHQGSDPHINTLAASEKGGIQSTPLSSPSHSSSHLPPPPSSNADSLRLRMVQRLYQLGIRNENVLRAMAEVPRHLFVDSALTNQAYEDTSLPIGLGQTISKPSVVARMIELIMPADGTKLHRVLDIGTGCAYQAAVLSHLVEEVYSVERLKGLHERSRVNLRPLRLKNVHLIYGDGMLGFPSGAPYDAIIAAAGGDDIPTAWLEQLSVGGCLVAPITSGLGNQTLVKVERTSSGWQQYALEAVQFVPLKSGVL